MDFLELNSNSIEALSLVKLFKTKSYFSHESDGWISILSIVLLFIFKVSVPLEIPLRFTLILLTLTNEKYLNTMWEFLIIFLDFYT